ncbi:MAG: hypothetical protein KF772_04795 [Cryobacterium sp.]|nr:hypothetical protein [Cryobacterium sp.]
MKCTKIAISLTEDTVVFSVESVVAGRFCMPRVEQLAAILPRMRMALNTAVGALKEDVVLLDHFTAELSDLTDLEEK